MTAYEIASMYEMNRTLNSHVIDWNILGKFPQYKIIAYIVLDGAEKSKSAIMQRINEQNDVFLKQFLDERCFSDFNSDFDSRVISSFVSQQVRFLHFIRFYDNTNSLDKILDKKMIMYRFEHVVIALPLSLDRSIQDLKEIYMSEISNPALISKYNCANETTDFIELYVKQHDPTERIHQLELKLIKAREATEEKIDDSFFEVNVQTIRNLYPRVLSLEENQFV